MNFQSSKWSHPGVAPLPQKGADGLQSGYETANHGHPLAFRLVTLSRKISSTRTTGRRRHQGRCSGMCRLVVMPARRDRSGGTHVLPEDSASQGWPWFADNGSPDRGAGILALRSLIAWLLSILFPRYW